MKASHLIRLTALAGVSLIVLTGCTLGNGLTRIEAESQLADLTCSFVDQPTISEENVAKYEALNTKIQASTINDAAFKAGVRDAAEGLRNQVGDEIDETRNDNFKLACQVSKDIVNKKFDEEK